MIKEFGVAYKEADMRAMHTPTWMKVIENAIKKMVDKISSLYSNCTIPGFGIVNAKKGLPWTICSFPTRYVCIKCSYTKDEKHPHRKYTEDHLYCDICNP